MAVLEEGGVEFHFAGPHWRRSHDNGSMRTSRCNEAFNEGFCWAVACHNLPISNTPYKTINISVLVTCNNDINTQHQYLSPQFTSPLRTLRMISTITTLAFRPSVHQPTKAQWLCLPQLTPSYLSSLLSLSSRNQIPCSAITLHNSIYLTWQCGIPTMSALKRRNTFPQGV
jgi:hypothetical protein